MVIFHSHVCLLEGISCWWFNTFRLMCWKFSVYSQSDRWFHGGSRPFFWDTHWTCHQAVRWRFPSDFRYLPAMAKLGYIRRSFKRPVSVGYDINDILISFMYPMVLQVWPAIDHFFPMDARCHSRKHPNHLNFSQAEGNARSAPPSQLIWSWYLDLTWF